MAPSRLLLTHQYSRLATDDIEYADSHNSCSGNGVTYDCTTIERVGKALKQLSLNRLLRPCINVYKRSTLLHMGLEAKTTERIEFVFAHKKIFYSIPIEVMKLD
jgi:hypothetical protein